MTKQSAPSRRVAPALALLGGKPVRSRAFASRPHIDGTEQAALAACLKDSMFSRFIGSPTPDVRRELRLPSAEVVKLKDFWSFMGGPNVRKFEALWAKAHGVPYAVAMNSATSGLTAAWLAAELDPGDEVITTPFSFTATATSVVCAQAVPVFADVDLDTFCLSADSVGETSGPRTRGLMPVHLLGNAGELDQLLVLSRRRGWRVVEDSAQAPGGTHHGKPLGSFGLAGVFSFQETKNVMTGEGGMVVTSNPAVAEKCRLIRNHGESIPRETDEDDFLLNAVGFNFRLTELCAALGWAQTQKLKMLNTIRRRNALYLRRRLEEVLGQVLRPQKVTNMEGFYPYCAGFRWIPEVAGLSRDLVAKALRAEGIPVSSGFPRLMSENPLFTRGAAFGRNGWPFRGSGRETDYSDGRARLPNAVRLQYHEYFGFFQIGWPNVEADMEDIVSAFQKILAHKDALKASDSESASEPASYDSGRR